MTRGPKPPFWCELTATPSRLQLQKPDDRFRSSAIAKASMVIRAVVFDLDGLMFDTEALFYRVSCEALAARGKTFTAEMMQAMLGRRAVDAAQSWKTLAGLDDSPEALLAEVRQRFFALVDTAVHPTPGLFVLLEHLARRNLPLAVATSSRRAYADRLLSQHGLLGRFQFILGSEDVTKGKPDPEIYLLAAERFAVPVNSLLVLEDSPAGLAAARGAGAFAVGVPHEHSPAQALHDADLIVSRLDEPTLLALIQSKESHGDLV
jgi:HAD superfamily hydrolase (TIGR01509 family)